MKNSPLTVLSIILFTFITKTLRAANTPVLDLTGEMVVTGTEYYMLGIFEGPVIYGGLNLYNGLSNTCPLDVIQEQWEILKGLPLIFSYPNDRRGSVVYESTDLNIKFSAAESTCFQPTVWRVGDYDNLTGQWFITGDGIEGNPGAQTLESWFKFQRGNVNAYKISHCPAVCSSCVSLCSAVGIYLGDGIRRLALSHIPFSIVLVKGSNATN
ncbi:hypothetical protein Pint_16654 [Pistacia integerrima]|uniref:Uncharacterized protein n=1 Tax=Pistacia integerrima TaxID=434235 RepID=A0ACC0ZEH2_9ROSI|nr:hypothetical protein Pint_16654 [Pistacia integerrima]